MVNFIKKNLLGSLREFRNRFINPIQNGQCADSTLKDVRIMKKRAHVLHAVLAGCVQYVLSVRISPLQYKMYRYYLDHVASKDTSTRKQTLVNTYAQRAKAACSPRSQSPNQAWYKHLLTERDVRIMEHSGKMVLLFEILRMAEDLDDKVVVDHQQIKRHFTLFELTELYTFEPDMLNDPNSRKSKRPTPILPKDSILAQLLQIHKDWIVSYHEHESLLDHKQEEELSEAERKAAWAEYEAEELLNKSRTNVSVNFLNLQKMRAHTIEDYILQLSRCDPTPETLCCRGTKSMHAELSNPLRSNASSLVRLLTRTRRARSDALRSSN
ncbi:hypothetical protein GOODEAATRI_007133 [Goodea atripinnis]|uniref:ATRX C-terminal domain-containing protein n=1 Tax=Goodea atripinnis TaxID=208336 RepID=A0ABV0PLJ9_9TELE